MTKCRTYAAIAILILAMTFSLIALPARAQPGVTLKSYPFVDAVPNPVGIGQQTLIRFGIFQQLGSVEFGWKGLTISVTRPDATTETLGPYTTDSTGGTAVLYTPNQEGTYKLTLNFPEQTNPADFFSLESGDMILAGTTIAASTSDPLALIVQQEPLPDYPGHPLPTEYWTRPIDPQLREWAPIAGNWVSRPDNWYAPYNQAPETAHVLWTKPLDYYGGLTGGLLGPGEIPASHETGDAYEGKWLNSVIIAGMLYYNRMPATFWGPYQPQNGIFAVDLHTGKEIWFRNNTWLDFGQIFYFNSFNYDGVYQYLWDTTSQFGKWNAYSPSTGEWFYSMINVPSGNRYFGPSGEILILQMDFAAGWMALWNSTRCGQQGLTLLGDFGSWARFVHGFTWDGSNPYCYEWNVTIPAGLSVGVGLSASALKVYDDRVVGLNYNRTMVNCWALNLNPAQRGQFLFNKVWQPPAEWLTGHNTLHYTGATNQVEKGVIALWDKELRKHYGFSTETGDFMWETASEHFLDIYGYGNAEHTWFFAYGKLYSVGVAGIVYAYDDQTGHTAWTYNMTEPYNEVVTGDNWWGWITFISDGKVYVGTVEHSAEMPIPRGGPYICLNATTGAEIWRVNGLYRQTRWGGDAILGDSIIATMDTYDQRIYAIGKGPTTTTVTVQDDTVIHGDSVLLKGYVTDNSPGTEELDLQARFPNGVPAVSDDSQSEWMLHVYKQFALPTSAKGVEVIVEVFDPNNNYYEVGRATSDLTGFYKLAFTPQVPGEYTIVARYAGSKAYFSSFAENAISVKEAPAPTASPTPAPASLADQYLLPATGGIIAAIAIVGVVLALLLRKR
jgi:hypothetical protein